MLFVGRLLLNLVSAFRRSGESLRSQSNPIQVTPGITANLIRILARGNCQHELVEQCEGILSTLYTGADEPKWSLISRKVLICALGDISQIPSPEEVLEPKISEASPALEGPECAHALLLTQEAIHYCAEPVLQEHLGPALLEAAEVLFDKADTDPVGLSIEMIRLMLRRGYAHKPFVDLLWRCLTRSGKDPLLTTWRWFELAERLGGDLIPDGMAEYLNDMVTNRDNLKMFLTLPNLLHRFPHHPITSGIWQKYKNELLDWADAELLWKVLLESLSPWSKGLTQPSLAVFSCALEHEDLDTAVRYSARVKDRERRSDALSKIMLRTLKHRSVDGWMHITNLLSFVERCRLVEKACCSMVRQLSPQVFSDRRHAYELALYCLADDRVAVSVVGELLEICEDPTSVQRFAEATLVLQR